MTVRVQKDYLAEAATRSISSLLPMEKAATSPSAALVISLTIPWTRVLLLPAVADVQPMARFLSAMSSLLLGEESTAFGLSLIHI